VELNLDNLLNRDYMTINGYPEPGRTLYLTLNYQHPN
jgi:outer membrane cobalamin receptor